MIFESAQKNPVFVAQHRDHEYRTVRFLRIIPEREDQPATRDQFRKTLPELVLCFRLVMQVGERVAHAGNKYRVPACP